MATKRTYAELKAFFETGDFPSQSQFEDWLFTVFKGASALPKEYKALWSQNAPIASQTSGAVNAGMLWTITTFAAGDDFSNWELISGAENTTGAVYRALTATPTVWTNGSDLAYDGAPYVVSTNEDGDFAPFINTLSAEPVLSRGGVGAFMLDLVGKFPLEKTWIPPSITLYGNVVVAGYRNNDDQIEFDTINVTTNTPADNKLDYTAIWFLVFP